MVVPPVRAFPSHGPFSPGPWCVPAEERREGSPEGEVLAAFSGEVTLVSRPPPGTGGNPKRCMRRPCSLAASQAAGVELRTFSSVPVSRPPILRRWHGWIKMRLVHLACEAAGKDDSIGRATGIYRVGLWAHQRQTERGTERERARLESVVVRIRAKRERVRQSSPIHPLHSNHPRGLARLSASRASRPPWCGTIRPEVR